MNPQLGTIDSSTWPEEPAPPPPRRFPIGIALLIAITFLAGIALAAVAVSRSARVAAMLHLVPQSAVPAPAPAPVARPVVPLEARLAAIEAHLDAVDQRAAASTGNADRAEGLLVAFAARRALDRGTPLGYIEGLMRERFGGIDPQSVAAVMAASHEPVTLDQLQTGFEKIRTQLMVVEPGDSWWTTFKHELGGLIVVRRAETPSTVPSDRVARVAALLDEGQVDRAMAEVARLPGRSAAAAWMGEARRYVGARNALDRIETAALLHPQGAPAPQPVAVPAE